MILIRMNYSLVARFFLESAVGFEAMSHWLVHSSCQVLLHVEHCEAIEMAESEVESVSSGICVPRRHARKHKNRI